MHNDRKSVEEWWGIRNWEGEIGNYTVIGLAGMFDVDIVGLEK